MDCNNTSAIVFTVQYGYYTGYAPLCRNDCVIFGALLCLHNKALQGCLAHIYVYILLIYTCLHIAMEPLRFYFTAAEANFLSHQSRKGTLSPVQAISWMTIFLTTVQLETLTR